ncbi:antibiotic biosynthesis monooxygenase [Paucibacter sp. AS339]|uniref:antibiotic biosynthesis monooxygenase family protein n=1 Tax=Paucibacter hankyongi TaxID=3133434 RepID=UPI0030B78DD5
MDKAAEAQHPGLAPLFEPPYYAVIFTSQRNSVALGYAETADRMVALAAQQPGYLGVESTRGADGLGITVSYWRSLQDIAAWRREGEHQTARDQGRADWYLHYTLRIAKVERNYGWDHLDGRADPMLNPAAQAG